MLQLTKSACLCTDTAESLADMRRAFDEHHVIRLREFFHPDLLGFVKQGIRQAQFHDRVHSDIAREDCMSDDNIVAALLTFLANDPQLFRAVEAITGCGTVRYFNGRVYLMRANSTHFDRWHSDATGTRMIGMSVNLSEGEFKGGLFQLTHWNREEPEVAVANTGPGDAILFRVHDDLIHRVTPIEGDIPRTAYAGWFQGSPDFMAVLKGQDLAVEVESVE